MSEARKTFCYTSRRSTIPRHFKIWLRPIRERLNWSTHRYFVQWKKNFLTLKSTNRKQHNHKPNIKTKYLTFEILTEIQWTFMMNDEKWRKNCYIFDGYFLSCHVCNLSIWCKIASVLSFELSLKKGIGHPWIQFLWYLTGNFSVTTRRQISTHNYENRSKRFWMSIEANSLKKS